MTTQTFGASHAGADIDRPSVSRPLTTETKAAHKTTEFFVYVAAVVGVLLASLLVGTNANHADYFRADQVWFYIVLLTIGYMGSRGLAKSGSRARDDR
jgi:hypothetical protein